jgi:hypothetical protein
VSLAGQLDFLASLIRQLQGALGGNRIVRGTVSPAGAIVVGEGFTSSKLATGTYQVVFDTAFSAPPSVVVSLGMTAGTVGIHIRDAVPITVSLFEVVTYSTGFLDAEFNFIAVGPA